MATKKREMKATTLRIYLTISLALIPIIILGGFLYISKMLSTYASEVSSATAIAETSKNNVETLTKIQQELITNKDIVQRADKIVAESKSYQYQNQIINDLSKYARDSNVSITNYDFSSTPTKQGTPSDQTKTNQSTSGIQSTFVSITLDNPMEYTDILKFINRIEQNPTRMQISKINLSKSEGGKVSCGVLSIEVYIK